MQTEITGFWEWQQQFSDEKTWLQAVEGVNNENVRLFALQTIQTGQTLNTDILITLKALTEEHLHVAKVTPLEMVNEWLPWVYIVISSFKDYLLRTYHGVPGCHLREYLDEFCYRINRRFWEEQIPNCLLSLSITYQSVFLNQWFVDNHF